MATITAKEVIEFITKKSNGRFFSVRFRKRSTGEERVMNCRYGVRSYLRGGEAAYDFKDHNLLCVWDAAKRDYRTIPLENLLEITINGEKFSVVKDSIPPLPSESVP